MLNVLIASAPNSGAKEFTYALNLNQEIVATYGLCLFSNGINRLKGDYRKAVEALSDAQIDTEYEANILGHGHMNQSGLKINVNNVKTVLAATPTADLVDVIGTSIPETVKVVADYTAQYANNLSVQLTNKADKIIYLIQDPRDFVLYSINKNERLQQRGQKLNNPGVLSVEDAINASGVGKAWIDYINEWEAFLAVNTKPYLVLNIATLLSKTAEIAAFLDVTESFLSLSLTAFSVPSIWQAQMPDIQLPEEWLTKYNQFV